MNLHNTILSKADWQPIWKFAAFGLLMVALVIIVSACGQAAAAAVKATWIKPQISGDTLSIAVNDVTNARIVHFTVNMALGPENFMAYQFNGQTYVRANVCPPCRSVGFSLVGDRLVCDSCKTNFSASSGAGINGACVAYPKAAVPFQANGDSLAMKVSDLQLAYQNTLEPGWP